MVQINLFLLYAVATIAPSLAHPFARFVSTLPLSHLWCSLQALLSSREDADISNAFSRRFHHGDSVVL